MATKIKKDDFDKYKVNGFKIGDIVYLPEANIQAEIIAVDIDDTVFDIMIDTTQVELSEDVFIGVPIEDCRSDTVYYRKKALKDKYRIWIDSANVQHVGEISIEEVILDR